MDADQFKLLYDSMQDQSKKIDALHGDFREFKGSLSEKVNNLKEDARSDRTWNRIQTVAVIPIVAALHLVASKLGIIKL